MENSTQDIAQQIQHLEQLRYQYLLEEQYDQFAALCHPELIYVHSSGQIDDCAGYTGKCNAGFYKYHKADLVIDRINVIGTVATVFGELNSEFLAGTTLKKLHVRILSVWVQLEGEWKFFAYQPTAIV